MIDLDTMYVFGDVPRVARWRKRLVAWLHERGLCDRPYAVALAWRDGPRSGRLRPQGIVYGSSPRDAAIKRLLMLHRSARYWPYVLVAVIAGEDEEPHFFDPQDEEPAELSMDEAVAVLAETRTRT